MRHDGGLDPRTSPRPGALCGGFEVVSSPDSAEALEWERTLLAFKFLPMQWPDQFVSAPSAGRASEVDFPQVDARLSPAGLAGD